MEVKAKAKKQVKSAHGLKIESYRSLIKLAHMFPKHIREISDFQYIKRIGKGGFGEVWLGQDLRTGKYAAIKELNATKLIGRNLVSFIREVQVSCRVKNAFVVPFIGYTLEAPYCIITEYMENGTLFNYTNRKHRKFVLSGTHMSIIATGIAFAMADCHRCHVMHRDLKAANILLDSNRMPRLCDFGISRNTNRERSYTVGIGTIPYMAPEAITTRNYKPSIDVYSYAVLLSEMIMGRNPFPGMSMEAITDAVTKQGIRPNLDRKSQPKRLIELIDACWQEDASKRPTFPMIFNSFRFGQVYFKGTDTKKFETFVNNFIEKYETDRSARKSVDPTKKKQKARPLVDVDTLVSRLEMKIKEEEEQEIQDAESDDATVEEEADISYEEAPADILQDPANPRFLKVLDFIVDHLALKQFHTLWQILLPHLIDESNEQLVMIIMQKLHQLVDRDPHFYEVFARSHVFSGLPLQNEEMRRTTFDLIAKLVVFDPALIRPPLFRVLSSFFTTMPAEVLSLFEYYVTHITPDLQVFDLLISFARLFLTSEHGSTFLIIIRHVIETYPLVREARFDKVWPIYTAFARSDDHENALEAFLCLVRVYDGVVPIPFDAILKWQNNDPITRAALSLLLRAGTYPVSRSLTRFLVEQAKSKAKAFRVLLQFAAQSKDHAQLCVINNRWMQYFGSDPMRLFLICFAHPSLRPELCGQGFPIFMRHCAKSHDKDVLTALPSIIHRIFLSESTIQTLMMAGFFQFLADTVKILDDSAIYNAAAVVLDTFARTSYVPDFKKFVPILVKMLKIPASASTAFSVIVTLSCHAELAQRFAQPTLVQFVESLRKNPNREKQATLFINNVTPYLKQT